MMQFLPFADPRALKVYQDFERAVYKALRGWVLEGCGAEVLGA